jgi:hypothetical protein
MSGVEEHTITMGICHIVGVVTEELRIEYIDEICTTHSTAGVTRLCLFYHRGSQDTDVIGCALKFVVLHNTGFFFMLFMLFSQIL